MSNIVCPECGASPLVNHHLSCSQPAYVDLRDSVGRATLGVVDMNFCSCNQLQPPPNRNTA